MGEQTTHDRRASADRGCADSEPIRQSRMGQRVIDLPRTGHLGDTAQIDMADRLGRLSGTHRASRLMLTEYRGCS